MTAQGIRIAASFEITGSEPVRNAALAAFPIAALVLIAGLGGIFVPATYARETTSRAAQGIGQDWISFAICAGVLTAFVRVRREVG